MDQHDRLDLSGRTALVTGGGRGIGRSISLALAAAGAHVHVAARSTDELRETVRQIQDQGGLASATAADLTDIATVRDVLVADVERDCGGKIDIVVNAIGKIGPLAPVAETDPGDWTSTLSTNVIAPYLVCRAFLPGMLARGWGRVVNISSAASLHPPARAFSSYQSSKIALNLFTRCLAVEIEGTGVTANALHPGEVKTAMWQDIAEQTASDDPQSGGMRPWVQWVAETGGDPPTRAAGVVRWLCSDEASAVNGRFVWIPGGLQTPLPIDWGMIAPEVSVAGLS